MPPTRLRSANLRAAALGLVLGAGVLAWVSGATGGLARENDFLHEAWPAYHVLAQGHLLRAIRIAPTYVGSLVLRAPFALLASAFGAGAPAVYFASALPCIAAEAAFCAWLSAQPRGRAGTIAGNRLVALLVWFLNPVVIVAVVGGHPEDLLGAVLCAAGVVLAVHAEERWSAILIGLAVANKTWAAVAVAVALVALPAGRRWRALLVIAGTAGAVLVPVTAVRVLSSGGGAGGAGAQLGAAVGSLSFPRDLLWWFGSHSWIVRESRWLLLVVTVCCALLWQARRVRQQFGNDAVAEAMLMLALVLLLRCALDPWDNLYYSAPFLLALLTYETRRGRTPWLTLLYSFLLIPVLVPHLLGSLSPNQHAAAYAAVALPMICWLASKLFVTPEEWGRLRAASRSAWTRARQATV